MSIKIRSRQLDQYVEVRILISHPMENGRNRDPVSHQLIPAHFIRELRVELNGRTIINAHLGGSVSKDPYFSFRLKSARDGDRLVVQWLDNLDLSDSAEHVITSTG